MLFLSCHMLILKCKILKTVFINISKKFFPVSRNGIFPLTAFKLPTPPPKPRAKTPEVQELSKSEDPAPVDVENRLVMQSTCSVKRTDEIGKYSITLQLKMDDKMNRQLTAEVSIEDTPENLAQELVHYGFINQVS